MKGTRERRDMEVERVKMIGQVEGKRMYWYKRESVRNDRVDMIGHAGK